MCCPPNIQQKTIENINHETQSHLMVVSLLGEPLICDLLGWFDSYDGCC